MGSKINIKDVYDKNLNFLIGSGASSGMLPTLALGIKGENEDEVTVEELSTLFEHKNKDDLNTLLFMHYYKECIKPAIDMDVAKLSEDQRQVLKNYESFLNTILTIMERRDPSDQKCNMFTTNYDGCFEFSAECMLSENKHNFILNDGAYGFKTRYLNAKHFNSYVYQTGVFDQHRTDIPQINLIHLHGSIFWRKHEENIVVDYAKNDQANLLDEELFDENLEEFSTVINDKNKTVANLPESILDKKIAKNFWDAYKQLPIVNPTKWKFHETVFEEHYYQMLRLLSYELEKPNSILITFGFSFADKHILRLVQRSLSNPKLQLFVCCFDESEITSMGDSFGRYKNVKLIHMDWIFDGVLSGHLDFGKFNETVFAVTKETDFGKETDAGAE